MAAVDIDVSILADSSINASNLTASYKAQASLFAGSSVSSDLQHLLFAGLVSDSSLTLSLRSNFAATTALSSNSTVTGDITVTFMLNTSVVGNSIVTSDLTGSFVLDADIQADSDLDPLLTAAYEVSATLTADSSINSPNLTDLAVCGIMADSSLSANLSYIHYVNTTIQADSTFTLGLMDFTHYPPKNVPMPLPDLTPPPLRIVPNAPNSPSYTISLTPKTRDFT
jgi:hypothetical protein